MTYFCRQLHKHNYDTSKSLQALVKGPSVMYKEKKWSEDDIVSKLFSLLFLMG